MSRPIPRHFDYGDADDEHLCDAPPDDLDEVVYVSKATGHLITHRKPRQNRQRRNERRQVNNPPAGETQPVTGPHSAPDTQNTHQYTTQGDPQ